MKIHGWLLVAAALGATMAPLAAVEKSAGDLRVEAQGQLKAGNFRDALEGYRKLVLDPREDAGQAPGDFQNALRCLTRLGRIEEIDSLRNEAIRVQKANWRLLRAAADSLISGQRFGYIVAGTFFRGNHRGGGEYVSSADRDRVRALQLMLQAIPLLKAESNPSAVADFYLDLARQILNGRTGGTAWKLQILTDLSKLPDYERAQGYLPFRRGGGGGGGGGGGTLGAPVDSDGNPVFYHVPSRLEAAQSDGERWRWALAQAVEASPQQKYPAALILANFLHGEFGVQTLAGFGRFPEEGDDHSEATGPFAVHTLKDDETIARLATGIKRFKLPDEFNSLRIYRDVATNGNNSQAQRALTTLATIFENRRQYPQAAETWRECIRRFGAGARDDRQKRLDQIVGNWGTFEQSRPQPSEKGRTLTFRFRNGKRLDLEAHAIHVEKLLDDVKAYLKSNPDRLDWNKLNIGDIGRRLLDQNQSQYLGERVAEWSVPLEPSPKHFDRTAEIAVPFQKAGAYFITAKIDGGNSSRILLWVADTAIVKKQLAAGAFYYVADAVSGAPIAGANVEFFGYRQESVGRNQFRIHTANFAETSDGNGQVFPDPKDLDRQYEWLAIARTPQGRLAFLGFEGIWYGASDQARYDQSKAFVITDRPVYRPGQTVKFKFWVREARYDAPSESKFAGQSFKVRVSDPQGQTVVEKTFTADAYGGFDGELPLSADATLGVYYAQLVDRNDVSGGGTFRVEEYKKPEFEVTVDAPREPALLGDKITATVSAKYYFGGPVTQASVHYKVTRTTETARWYPFGIWDWCYGPGYWWFWPESTWYPGWHHWGFAPPRPFWLPFGNEPPEVVLDATVPISSDGTLKIEIDTAAAKELHGNADHRYDITAEVVDQSRRTIVGTGKVLVARKPFQVVAWTDRGYYQAGGTIHASFHAQTLDHKPVTGKGVATLYRVTYDADAKPTETAEQTWNLDPDPQGNAKLQIDASKGGQYRLSYQVTDEKRHAIEGAVLLTIFGSGTDTARFRFNHLELIPDQREYAPGGKVRLRINTERVDSTVVLFVRALNGVYPKPQIVRLQGKSTVVEIAVAQSDMPNFFVEAFTVSDAQVHSETREIVVPPEKRVLNVAVLPSAHEFKPGAEARVTLKLTDLEGKPVTGSIVLSAYDKSVEYVSAGTNVPEIREFFWKWQRTHYPQGSSSLDRVSYNLLEPNETPMRQIGVFGQLAEQSFPRAPGGIRRAYSAAGKSREKSPAPMARAVAGAPLFEAEAPSSAAAPPAEVEPTVRKQFADTAFWAARIVADPDGVAAVSFPMPENLTTWKIRGWAMGSGTRVGQGDAEVLTTKNLLVRMQAPRFFVETDEVVLSAIVHNHLKTSKSVRVALEMDGRSLAAIDGATKTVEVAAGGETRVDWRVKAVEHGEAVVRMKALTDEESDAVQMSFPVRIHGMLKTESYTGSIRPDRESASFKITVPDQRRINDTRLEIRYSPTLAGAMVDALPYLVGYPHDATDCTLYRFLPTVITQNILKRMNLDLAAIKAKRANLNAQELGDPSKRAAGWKRFDDNPVFDNAEVDRLVKRGVKALTEMQLSDGGWGWFSGWGEHSEPHMTAQVVHGLQLARQNGVALVPGMLERGVEWLKIYQAQQIVRLKNGSQEKPVEPYKKQADNVDAFVYFVLVEADVNDPAMQEFLYRDRVKLSVYAKGLFGLALSAAKAADRLAMIVQNIDQYLVQDDENQTAWLRLPEGVFWWFWYGNETEANAYYLKLLARTDPKGEKAPRLARYLLNNRKHATYWNSPRDTAIAIEALADYVVASGEDRPELQVEVQVDGKQLKEVAIDAKNLFTFDDRAVVIGDALSSGPHTIELRKHGKGPLYFDAYLTNFTLEDPIRSAGLEIKVARTYFKLVRDDVARAVAGGQGQVVRERTEKYRRVPLHSGDEVKSGDLIEIELAIDSKNDYEHLIFADPKAAGVEPYDVQSGYNAGGLGAYVQLRDENVTLFVRSLARGKHSLRYRMRAEIPGRFSALPTLGSGMYAPELKGNSDEMKIRIND